ncbi:hypothetical protein D3C81_315360 [compost metagenome]
MNELTPEQLREHHLGRIRNYAEERGIDGEAIATIFETGIAAAGRLRPELLGTALPSEGEVA